MRAQRTAARLPPRRSPPLPRALRRPAHAPAPQARPPWTALPAGAAAPAARVRARPARCARPPPSVPAPAPGEAGSQAEHCASAHASHLILSVQACAAVPMCCCAKAALRCPQSCARARAGASFANSCCSSGTVCLSCSSRSETGRLLFGGSHRVKKVAGALQVRVSPGIPAPQHQRGARLLRHLLRVHL